jgi:transaldolase
MDKNPVYQIKNFGQSIWYDNIQRSFITAGKLANMVSEDGVCGVTSNPTIFEKAIGGSSDYDAEIKKLVAGGKTADEIYDSLTIKDVSLAADVLSETYRASEGKDGYVSIEVSPKYAYDTGKTIDEAVRLAKEINKPNIMIKVPATKQGVDAIKILISKGININATLIFSINHYRDVAQAYIEGLKESSKKEGTPGTVNSVASVFISRVDTTVDKLIDKQIDSEKDEKKKKYLENLKGKTAVAYVKKIYQISKEIFSQKEFAGLKAKGAKIQRPLWASTGTKNPAYSDIKYIEELIAPDTVNTVPQATLDAFRDHGRPGDVIEKGLDKANQDLSSIESIGINLDEVCETLQKDGLASFEKSFDTLIGTIKQKIAK